MSSFRYKYSLIVLSIAVTSVALFLLLTCYGIIFINEKSSNCIQCFFPVLTVSIFIAFHLLIAFEKKYENYWRSSFVVLCFLVATCCYITSLLKPKSGKKQSSKTSLIILSVFYFLSLVPIGLIYSHYFFQPVYVFYDKPNLTLVIINKIPIKLSNEFVCLEDGDIIRDSLKGVRKGHDPP